MAPHAPSYWTCDLIKENVTKIRNSNGNEWAPSASNLQSALDDLDAGGKLWLPPMEVATTSEITVDNANVEVTGAGRKTILSTTSAINILKVNAINCRLSDIGFKGSGSYVAGQDGIYVARQGNWQPWNNLYFEDIGDTCIATKPTYGKFMHLVNCYFHDYYYRAIHVDNTNGMWIHNCFFRALAHAAFGVTANDGGLVGFEMIGCSLYDHTNTALNLSQYKYAAGVNYKTFGAKVIGCNIMDNNGRGILLNNVDGVNIIGCRIIQNNISDNAAYQGVQLVDADYNLIEGTIFSGNKRYDISIDADSETNRITNNLFTPSDADRDAVFSGTIDATNRIHNNFGYVTENSGSDSIANGTTSKVVAHGLAVTPSAEDFTIIGKENPTNDVGTIWVDTIGATNFTVNVENDPGASNWDFGWKVIVL